MTTVNRFFLLPLLQAGAGTIAAFGLLLGYMWLTNLHNKAIEILGWTLILSIFVLPLAFAALFLLFLGVAIWR